MLYGAALLALVKPLGHYVTLVTERKPFFLSRVLGPFERLCSNFASRCPKAVFFLGKVVFRNRRWYTDFFAAGPRRPSRCVWSSADYRWRSFRWSFPDRPSGHTMGDR